MNDGGLTRRAMLGVLGLGGLSAAAWLAGCESEHVGDQGIAAPAPAKPAGPAVAADTHGILPRSAWTRVGPVMSKIQPMGGVKLITFHHSGDPKAFTATDYAATVQHLESVRQ